MKAPCIRFLTGILRAYGHPLVPSPKAPFLPRVVEKNPDPSPDPIPDPSREQRSVRAAEAPGTSTDQEASKRWVIAIEGPTAVGKTAVAIAVAQAFQTEILNADARQCYRELCIGVARPSPAELASIKHHFIADRSVHNPLSAGAFEREGLARLAQLHQDHALVVLAGGSGLYVKAVLEGLDAFPSVTPQVQESLRQRLEKEGIESLQGLLQEHDPAYAKQVDLHNPHRLLRALAVCLSSGRPYSSFLQGSDARPPRPFETLRIALSRERAHLYERINARVLAMVEEGLVEEARRLLPLRRLSPLDTVGYRELFAHFEGSLSLDEAIALIQRNSRRYAKRQSTWLQRQAIDRSFEMPEEGLPPALLDYLAAQTGIPLRSFPG